MNIQAEKMSNQTYNRRFVTLGALTALGATAACGNGVGGRGGAMIDARVDATLAEMYRGYPNTRQLAEKANGMLVMPLVTEAGLGFGGAYGRGALRVNDVTVDYYSVTKASGGLQIGAQQYAHVLFFMTEPALREFRSSPGWAAGAGLGVCDLRQGRQRERRHNHRHGPRSGGGLWPRGAAHRRDAGRHEIHADHPLMQGRPMVFEGQRQFHPALPFFFCKQP